MSTEYQLGRFEGIQFEGNDVAYLRNRSEDFIKGFKETFRGISWF